MTIISNKTKAFSDMVSAVYFLVREDEDVFSNDEVKRSINSGLGAVFDAMSNEPTLIWSETTPDIAEYDLPEVRLSNGRAVVDSVFIDNVAIGGSEFYVNEDDTATGTPDTYMVNGSTLILSPIPDAAYTIKVILRQDFAPLVEDTDTATLNDIEIEAALFYAAHLLKAIDEEYESSQYFKNQYMELLGRAQLIKPGIYKDGTTYGMYGGAQ